MVVVNVTLQMQRYTGKIGVRAERVRDTRASRPYAQRVRIEACKDANAKPPGDLGALRVLRRFTFAERISVSLDYLHPLQTLASFSCKLESVFFLASEKCDTHKAAT